MAEPTDTPINKSFPPPSRLEGIKAFVGDLARPFAIIGTTVGVNTALVMVASKLGPDASAAAIFIGAAFAGLTTLYGAKAWEAVQAGKHTASVEIAKTTTVTTEPQK
jgi:hypothetical protein